jgi:hypothetical protein
MVAPLPTLFEAFLFEHFFAIMFKQFGAFMHVVNQMGKSSSQNKTSQHIMICFSI